jgi:hypothetical protein
MTIKHDVTSFHCVVYCTTITDVVLLQVKEPKQRITKDGIAVRSFLHADCSFIHIVPRLHSTALHASLALYREYTHMRQSLECCTICLCLTHAYAMDIAASVAIVTTAFTSVCTHVTVTRVLHKMVYLTHVYYVHCYHCCCCYYVYGYHRWQQWQEKLLR